MRHVAVSRCSQFLDNLFVRGLLLILASTTTLAEQTGPEPLKSGDLVKYPSDYCADAFSGEYWDYVVVGGGKSLNKPKTY